MAYGSLAEFLEDLDHEGQLVRVTGEVEPDQEAAEIARRVAAEGGQAVLFASIKGHRLAVAADVLGSEARIVRALGAASLGEVSARLGEYWGEGQAQGWLQRIRGSAGSERWQPRQVKIAPCQQVVKLATDVDLRHLPALRSWPAEPGRSFAGLVAARSADGQEHSLSQHWMQVVDGQRLLIQGDPYGPLARQAEVFQAQREPMPVAVVLGGHPVWLLAACSRWTSSFDPHVLAGVLRGQPCELVKCRTSDLRVPAECDLVLEGLLESDPLVSMQPIGTASGYCTPPLRAYSLRATAVTERTNAIFPASLASEATALEKAAQRLMLPLIQAAIPGLVDCNLLPTGVVNQYAFVSIRKRYAHQARQVAAALWGWEPTMLTKIVVLLDEDVDVHSADSVWRQVGANVDPGRDIFFHERPADPLDHAASAASPGQSLAIDATAKIAGEQANPWPGRLQPSDEIAERVARRWSEYGIRRRS